MGPGLQVPFSQKCEEKLDLRTQHISESACTAHLRGSHTERARPYVPNSAPGLKRNTES